jgi:hypothetical protein
MTTLPPKFHLAISVEQLDASIEEYSRRLGCEPCAIVPNEYALWRTATLNFSIRRTEDKPGTLRHLGWEDESAEALTEETDINGIVWERFAPHHQQQEIETLWPD